MVQRPNMMTIRQIAAEGILSEYSLRLLLKAGRLPAIYVGKKALINRDKLFEQLANLQGAVDSDED